MTKLKKFIGGALATVFCAATILSKPVVANAAAAPFSICSHSSSCYNDYVNYSTITFQHWTDEKYVRTGPGDNDYTKVSGNVWCFYTKETHTYICSHCNAHYTQSVTSLPVHRHYW